MAKRNSYREKVVDIYEKFFMGQDITGGKEDFWDEFFLLKVNINELNHHFKSLSLAQLMCLKPQVNRLNAKCVETIQEDNWYRSANAAQTLQTFVNGIFSSTTMLGQSDNLIGILFGTEYEDITKLLIKKCHCIIFNQTPIRLKAIILNLLLGLVTATNLIQENPLIELMLNDDLLSDIVLIISDYTYRSLLGKEAMFLVTLMMQFNRNQDNLFRLKMSGIEEQIVLNGISHLISIMYVEFIGRSTVVHKQTGLFSSFTSMFGNLISRTEATQNVKITESCFLLTLFDFLQLNSHFSYIITSPHSVFQCPSVLDEEVTERDMAIPSTSNVVTNQKEIKQNQPITDLGSVCEDPTNIIAVFLEYCSIVMQDIREPSAYNNCRLCFLILLSLSEDQNTATTLHDTHLAFKVTIHKKQMRHRKLNEDKNSNNSRPLVCGILDVAVEFMLCHIMKAFPSDLFNIVFDVIYRLVCFQKSRQLRIKYDWTSLWSCLINVTKYLISNFEDLPKTCNIYQLLNKIEIIFNLFITYGDAFLYCPTVYDHLYYEIIRQASVFENLYNFLIRTSVSKVDKENEVIHVFDHLINIRAIIQHFNPRIEVFAEENHISCLTPEQILEIISANYDSLTLKLHKNLDKYQLYTSKTEKEMAFFDILTRAVVIDIRDWSLVRCRELQNNLKEILISQQKLSMSSTSQPSTV